MSVQTWDLFLKIKKIDQSIYSLLILINIEGNFPLGIFLCSSMEKKWKKRLVMEACWETCQSCIVNAFWEQPELQSGIVDACWEHTGQGAVLNVYQIACWGTVIESSLLSNCLHHCFQGAIIVKAFPQHHHFQHLWT